MPFSLKNVPSELPKRMDDNFRPCIKFLAIYVDDILVLRENWGEHIEHLEKFQDLVYGHGLVFSDKFDKMRNC